MALCQLAAGMPFNTLVCYRLQRCETTHGMLLLITEQFCVSWQQGYLSTPVCYRLWRCATTHETKLLIVEQLCQSAAGVPFSTLVCYRLQRCAVTLGTKLLIVGQLYVSWQLVHPFTLLFVTGCEGVQWHWGQSCMLLPGSSVWEPGSDQGVHPLLHTCACFWKCHSTVQGNKHGGHLLEMFYFCVSLMFDIWSLKLDQHIFVSLCVKLC